MRTNGALAALEIGTSVAQIYSGAVMGTHTRYGWIDALRGVAALAVALFHFNEVPDVLANSLLWSTWRAVWSYGHLGVPMFFVLSGYCIGAAALKCKGVGEFAFRRARRIFPAYWASLAVIVTLVLLRRGVTGVNDMTALPNKVGEIAATLLLFTEPLSTVKTVNWVYWSLTFELAFYVAVGAILVAVPRSRRVSGFTAGTILLCLVALTVAPAQGPTFFLRLWPLFAIGLVPLLLPLSPASALAVLIAAGGQMFVTARLPIDALYDSVALSTTLFLLVLRRIPFEAPIALRWLGERSYGLFLLHVPVGCYAVRWITGSPAGPWAAFAQQTLQLAVAVVAAAFCFRAIEQPLSRLSAVATERKV